MGGGHVGEIPVGPGRTADAGDAIQEPHHLASWDPPPEIARIRPTDLEDDLRDLMVGPDDHWMQHDATVGATPRAEEAPSSPEEAERLQEMEAVDGGPHRETLRAQPPLLGVYFRNRLRRGRAKGEEVTLDALAKEAVEFGCPELADQAYSFLRAAGPAEKAGAQRDPDRAWVGEISWGRADVPGQGQFRWGGATWEMEDYRDQLLLEPELLEVLDGPAPTWRGPRGGDAAVPLPQRGGSVPWVAARPAPRPQRLAAPGPSAPSAGTPHGV